MSRKIPESTSFLQRWSAKKQAAKTEAIEPPTTEKLAPELAPETPHPLASQQPPPLPDISTLSVDSDYLPFMAKTASAQMRKLALQKLFHDPKFNVIDELNDYIGDYTQFTPLGDMMTADRQFQMLRQVAETLSQPPQIAPPDSVAESTNSSAAAVISDDPNPSST